MLHNYYGTIRTAVRTALGSLALAVAALTFVSVSAPAQTGDWVVPERRARRPNPIERSPQAVSQGRDIYRQECKSCHGTSGLGDGPKAAELEKKPSNLTMVRVQEQSDGALFWKITEGRGDMPNSRTTLTDEQRWMLVHYIRSLAKETP